MTDAWFSDQRRRYENGIRHTEHFSPPKTSDGFLNAFSRQLLKWENKFGELKFWKLSVEEASLSHTHTHSHASPLTHVAGRFLQHVCRHHMPTKRGRMPPTTGCLRSHASRRPTERHISPSTSFRGVRVHVRRMTNPSFGTFGPDLGAPQRPRLPHLRGGAGQRGGAVLHLRRDGWRRPQSLA